MKQSAKNNHIHLIICNTDEMESAEVEQEIIQEQRNNQIDAFLVWPASGSETEEMLKNECADVPVILIVENVYNEDEQESSTFSEIGPDYYEMGACLLYTSCSFPSLRSRWRWKRTMPMSQARAGIAMRKAI